MSLSPIGSGSSEATSTNPQSHLCMTGRIAQGSDIPSDAIVVDMGLSHESRGNQRKQSANVELTSDPNRAPGDRRRQFAVERSGPTGAALTRSDARRASRSDRLLELGVNAPRPAPARPPHRSTDR